MKLVFLFFLFILNKKAISHNPMKNFAHSVCQKSFNVLSSLYPTFALVPAMIINDALSDFLKDKDKDFYQLLPQDFLFKRFSFLFIAITLFKILSAIIEANFWQKYSFSEKIFSFLDHCLTHSFKDIYFYAFWGFYLTLLMILETNKTGGIILEKIYSFFSIQTNNLNESSIVINEIDTQKKQHLLIQNLIAIPILSFLIYTIIYQFFCRKIFQWSFF